MPRKIDDANIKNCPFCGEGSTHLQESSEPIYPHYRIVHECGIKGKKLKMRIETKWCETQSEAIKLWNTRYRKDWEGIK